MKEGDKEQENESDRMTQNARKRGSETETEQEDEAERWGVFHLQQNISCPFCILVPLAYALETFLFWHIFLYNFSGWEVARGVEPERDKLHCASFPSVAWLGKKEKGRFFFSVPKWVQKQSE